MNAFPLPASVHFRLCSSLVVLFVLPFLHVLPALGAKAAPVPGSISIPRAVARGELNEYPDVAVDGTGVAHVVWLQFDGEREHIMYRTYVGARGGEVIDVGGPWARQYWPRVAAFGSRAWVTWCAREGGDAEAPWTVYVREVSGGRLHGVVALSDGERSALRPAIGVDAGGIPWIAWESLDGDRFRVVARPLDAEGVPGRLFVVGERAELNLRPALAPHGDRGLVVVWDAYAYGEYQVYARTLDLGGLGEIIRISDENAFNIGAFAHTMPTGEVVVAYATNAGDSGDQRVGKELRVRILSGGDVYRLAGGDPPRVNTAPERRDAIEFPSVVSDAAGRIWLFARRGQGTIVFCYDGKRWTRPRDLSEPGWGGRGRELRAARAGSVFHLVTRRLHMLSHQLWTPAKGAHRLLALAPAQPPPASDGEAPTALAGIPPRESWDAEPPLTLTASLGFPYEVFGARASGYSTMDGASLGADDRNDDMDGDGLGETPGRAGWIEAPASRAGALDAARPDAVGEGASRTSGWKGSRSGGSGPRAPRLSAASAPAGGWTPTLPSLSRPWREPDSPDRSPLKGVVIPDGVGAPRPTLSSAARFNVLDPEDGPMPVERPAGLYFGDLHTHSWMSDGAGDPDEVYTRSRDRYRYDFVALTDHDYENGNILLPSEWAYLKLMADFFNRPGEFVTFQAYEWTAPAYPRGPGHRNVYFSGDASPLFSASGAGKGTKTLFELLKQYRAVAVPHHIGWTGTDWENHDDKVQRAVEVVSVHGAFEKPGNLPVLPRHELAGMFVRDGLLRQCRFGFVGGSDGHGFPWHYGVSRKEDVWRTGLTGVRAPALNRKALHAALYNRSTYATSGAPIVLSFSADGFPMGSELELTRPPRFDIRVEGSATLTDVVLVRDTEDIRHFKAYGGKLLTSVYDNPTVGSHFYYIRAVQEDGELALSSPIWVELKGKVRVGPPDP